MLPDHVPAGLAPVMTGLAEGRGAMKAKSGTAWDRHQAIQAAWRAAGSPHKSDVGWAEWVLERDRLRQQLGSKRAFAAKRRPVRPIDP